MKRKLLVLLALAVATLLSCSAPVAADPNPYDGLKMLGVGSHFVDEGGATLDLMAFRTKYDEKVVGMYFASGSRSVHFYMNAVVWDKLKQQLVRARDSWDSLDARAFEGAGAVKGYAIAGRQATLRLGLQGATALQPKQLLFTASSSAAPGQQIVISLLGDQLKDFVDDLSTIDQLFRTP